MGTNYYLRSRRPVRTVVTHEGDEHGRVVGVRREYAECHLCKLSYGWRPLMACDTDATIPGARFTSFREMMRFIRDHAGEYMIHDEYATGGDDESGYEYEEISPNEFEQRVRDWGRGFPRKPESHGSMGATVDGEGFEFMYGDFA